MFLKSVLSKKNKAKTWLYGYNEKYDMVVISKSGQIEQIININGLAIALPKKPETIYSRDKKKENQYWEREELPKDLSRITSIFQWNDRPPLFKNKWVDYIEEEFDRRELGFGFTTTESLHILPVLIICIYNGQVLMWDILILEKQTEYSFCIGKLVKLIKDVLD